MDRDCENCKHKVNGACESWDCEFEPREPVRNPDQLDCVSRQEMLKYFEGWKNQIKYYHPYAKNFDIPYEEAIQWVKELPPVNPQKPICPSAGVDCEDCPAYEDTISRQAAIDAIYARYIGGKEVVDKAPANDQYAEGIDEAVCAVEDLPPVTPQPKTDWIVPIILIDEKGEEHDGLMDMRRMLIYLHNIPAETAISLGYTWKSAEGSGKE